MAREGSENRNALTDRLKGEVGNLVGALSNRAVTSLLNKVEGTTGRLQEYVEGESRPRSHGRRHRGERPGRRQVADPVRARRRDDGHQGEDLRPVQEGR